MSSITITMRVDLRAVVGCGELARKQGIDTRTQPVSTVCRGTLESIIRWLETQGEIPLTDSMNESYLKQRYNELFNTPEVQPPEDGLNISDLAQNIKNTFSQDEIADIVEKVEQTAQKHRETDVMRETGEVVTTDIVETPVDLSTINRMDIANLEIIKPKDPIIREVLDGIPEPGQREALEIIYTKLSPELWGTETARQQIKQLQRRHIENGTDQEST